MERFQKTRRRWVLAAGLTGLCGFVAYFVWFARRDESLPTVVEVMAALAIEPAEIAVGPNVRVSGADPTVSHREVIATADPADPRRLFAAAMCHPHKDQSVSAVV